MKHLASAYGRALFPRRYGAGDGDAPMALPPDGLDLDLAAALYRLTGHLEHLVDRLVNGPGWRTTPGRRGARRSGRRTVECG